MSNAIDRDDDALLEHGDEPLCNHSSNPVFADIVDGLMSRRALMQGGLATAVVSLFAAPRARAETKGPQISFEPIPVAETDAIIVPPGYTARVLTPWGEPITGAMPAFSLSNSGADQAMQIGQHHDGVHYYPIEGKSPYAGSSEDGLLVINHEYVEPRFMHVAAQGQALTDGDVPVLNPGPEAESAEGFDLARRFEYPANARRDADQVLKELNAHGVAVARIQKGADGRWAVTKDDRNRRITMLTPMEISGPARGSKLLQTKYSPTGERTRGTLNNCAHGVTPWNTYLTCEENWARYFVNRDEKPPREHARYGVATTESRYLWDQAEGYHDEFRRFDASSKGASAPEDYRNEPNLFGWVVEIDPFNPSHTPVKRTALGRFAHEGVVFAEPVKGEPLVAYSGDDARFEYIYKFVSAEPFDPATADGRLLDAGRLYVARFNADGTGDWLPLVHGEGPLTPEHGFHDQADVLVNTRIAGDLVGATKMDRPEWGAIDPHTGEVYFTLTNNNRRLANQVDPANPRPANLYGHIVRWRENEGKPAASGFRWDLFVLAGSETDSRKLDGEKLGATNIFACPDGLWFDKDGRMWIQTDIGEREQNVGPHKRFGNNAMLCANPETGEIRRFLTGPVGQEITGVVTTPDQKTMFINVQHPGATTSKEDFAAGQINSRWPNEADPVPRSATVVITRDDGGVIGT